MMQDLHGSSSDDQELMFNQEDLQERIEHVRSFEIPPLRMFLEEIASLSASYEWLWEFTGYFMTRVEGNLCQLLCFPETIANIRFYTLAVGSTDNTSFEGERIIRLGSLQNVEDGSIISIGPVTLFLNELFPRRSQLGNEGFVIASSINSRTIQPVFQPVRIYSAEGVL